MGGTAPFLLAAAGLFLLAGCAAPSSPAPAGPVDDLACVPSFGADGRVRRDVATDAPLFVAPAESLAARCPRFNDDGTVCRDAETGDVLYEEVSGGEVVRVLLLPSR